MIKTYFLNPQKIPLVVENAAPEKDSETLLNLATARREFFREKLLQHGTLLFRGFDVRTTGEFETFARRFSQKEFFRYAGGVSPRIALNGNGVYTSTEYPPHLALALHNELSYSKIYPRHLYFFCRTAPAVGGETTLGDSRRILRKINPQIADSFRHKNVRYERNLCGAKGSGYSWQEAFETEDKREVEKICREIGADFEWKETGDLRLSQVRPATCIHPETGEEVWFNQADGFHPSNLDAETREWFLANNREFRLNACFGDGAIIPLEFLERIRAVLKSETVPHRWETGDVLIVDNLLAAHGRMPFSGARKIILAMT
jgi:alpha-ketoglutarate-dependent taurine dioxygenase